MELLVILEIRKHYQYLLNLKKLEYIGYNSSGVVCIIDNKFKLLRMWKNSNIENKISKYINLFEANRMLFQNKDLNVIC